MTYCDICTKKLDKKNRYSVYGYTPYCRVGEYECRLQLCEDCYANMFKDVVRDDDENE